jgi:hypothetical protein
VDQEACVTPRPSFTIDGIDTGPDDLARQLPRTAELVRPIPGPDRPDYGLAVLKEPVTYDTTLTALRSAGVDLATADPQLIQFHPDGEQVRLHVFGIVVATRTVGDRLHGAMSGMPVMLAYVVDNSVMGDETLDFSKCVYVAVAFVSGIPDAAPGAAPSPG